MALDLRVVGSSLTFGIETTLKKKGGDVIKDGKYERKVKDTEERLGRYNISLI